MQFNLYTKIIIFFISSIAIITTFQNCAQSNESSFEMEDSTSPGDNEVYKQSGIDLSKASSINLQLNSFYSAHVNARNDISHLLINLTNGEMRYVNHEGQFISPIRLCLQKAELIELRSIIEKAKVCTPQTKASTDTVCTQEYIYPYAKLHLINNELIKFGEKSGCSKGLDLCDEHKKALNGFTSYLSSHLDNRKCL